METLGKGNSVRVRSERKKTPLPTKELRQHEYFISQLELVKQSPVLPD